MSRAVVHVCTNCRNPSLEAHHAGAPGGAELKDEIAVRLKSEGLDDAFDVAPVTCLGACGRRVRVSVAAPDRWSWLIGDLTPGEDLAPFLAFLRQWRDTPDGLIPKPERSKWLLRTALGRLPPFSGPTPEASDARSAAET